MASPEKQQNGSLSQAPEKQEPAAAENDAEELPKPKPTTLKRLVDKVGLNAATLVLMFKPEANLHSFASSGTFYTNIFLLCIEALSLLLLAYQYTNRHEYPLTSRRWDI
jgi:hypothetical protein